MQRLSHTFFLIAALLLFFPAAPGMGLAETSPNTKQALPKPSPQLNDALNKAESLAEKSNYASAEQTLNGYAAAHPAEHHALLYYELGYFCYRQGKLEQSIAHLQKAVDNAPQYGDAWQLLAMAWQEKGNRISKEDKEKQQDRVSAMIKGATAMEKAASLGTDNDLRYQAALLWLEGEKPKKALTILEPLTRLEDAREEWFIGLSETMKALKRSEEMAEAMEKAAKVKNDPKLYFHAAWLWNELDKPKRALPLLKPLAERKNPDKNWLLLLVSVYNELKQPADAAQTMEKVIAIDPAPDYLYNCGLLWLQADNPDKALHSLIQLADVEPPKADWFVATTQGWLLKDNIEKAADAMERAAMISGDPEHRYRAGALRLQLKQADRAIKLLTPLADLKKPKSEWMVALANSWLLKENYHKGAIYMEKAAYISGQGKLFHRAAMLWRIEDNLEKTVTLLRKSVAVKEVEQLWLIDLASVLLDLNRINEIPPVMARTKLENKEVSNQLRYRGAVIWLNLQKPARAYPLLKILSKKKNPQYSWLSSLVKTCVELEHIQEAEKNMQGLIRQYPEEVKTWKLAVWLALQQSDYKKAVAAKEILRRFEPENQKHIEELSRLYLLTGIPCESAELYKKTVQDKSDPEALHHLIDIYLSGQHYEQALEAARKVTQIENGEQRDKDYETLGDIYYALHQYDKSSKAYEEAALAGESADIYMKAAYAAMKAEQLQQAIDHFEKAIELSNNDNSLVESVAQNLTYVKRRLKEQEEMSQVR